MALKCICPGNGPPGLITHPDRACPWHGEAALRSLSRGGPYPLGDLPSSRTIGTVIVVAIAALLVFGPRARSR
jgi:hypothetical protein